MSAIVKSKCEFNTQARLRVAEEACETVVCPGCGHIVVMGLPHPNFDSPKLPVSEAELTRLSNIAATPKVPFYGDDY